MNNFHGFGCIHPIAIYRLTPLCTPSVLYPSACLTIAIAKLINNNISE